MCCTPEHRMENGHEIQQKINNDNNGGELFFPFDITVENVALLCCCGRSREKAGQGSGAGNAVHTKFHGQDSLISSLCGFRCCRCNVWYFVKLINVLVSRLSALFEQVG